MSFGFPSLFGTGAHSGATVTDFNRVPFGYPETRTSGPMVRLCFLFKEQSTQLLSDLSPAFKQKIKIIAGSGK
jgi:hypothetical protein